MTTSESNMDEKTFYFKNTKSLSNGNLSTTGIVKTYRNGAVCVESAADIRNGLTKNRNVLRKRVYCSCSSEFVCSNHSNKQSISSIKSKPTKTPDVEKFPTSSKRVPTANLKKEKDETFKNWTLKKTEEKKKIAQNKIDLKALEDKEKQIRLEQENENFKRWLLNKNKEKEKERLEKQKKLELEKEKAATKELRNMESQIRYQLWLKQKEEIKLENELRAQMKMLKLTENRNKRTSMNQTAYTSWLESSKTKQRPLPHNKGFDSLRSAASVTYVNPIPWAPNIE